PGWAGRGWRARSGRRESRARVQTRRISWVWTPPPSLHRRGRGAARPGCLQPGPMGRGTCADEGAPPPTKAPRNGAGATGETIRAAGLRATPQRLAVLFVVARAGGAHLSADDVWLRLREGSGEMDRSTVY